jgi:hypothetical protein
MLPCLSEKRGNRIGYLSLVRHVLATLHGPYQIELPIRKRLLQSISNLQSNLLCHADRRSGGRETLETGGYSQSQSQG